MQDNNTEIRVFSLSMLDAILGGLGAMVIVVLLLSRLLDIASSHNEELRTQVASLSQELEDEQRALHLANADLARVRAELEESREALESATRTGSGDRNEHREWREGSRLILTDVEEQASGWRIRYRCSPGSGWICNGCGGSPVSGGGYSGQ